MLDAAEASVLLAKPVRAVARGLELLRQPCPAEVHVVGVHLAELLAMVDGQASAEERPAGWRAMPVHVVIRQHNPRLGQRGDVLRIRGCRTAVDPRVGVAQVVLQDRDDVRLYGSGAAAPSGAPTATVAFIIAPIAANAMANLAKAMAVAYRVVGAKVRV